MGTEKDRKRKMQTLEQAPKKSDRMHFRVDPELKKEIQEAAREDVRSAAQWVEFVVRRALSERRKH